MTIPGYLSSALIVQMLLLVLAGCTAGGDSDGVDAVRQSASGLIVAADSVLRAAVEEGVVPGAVLAVSRGGEILHRKAYGFARLYEFGGERLADPEPMSVDHVFDVASLTKVFATTFGIMILVDRGEVDLDAPVSEYLPAFSGPHKDSIRVRHLLTHGAGLFPWKPVYYHARNQQEAFTYTRGLPTAYPVGRERHYSDLGFMLLGYLIEERTGRSIDAFLREELYLPMDLTRTTYVPRAHGVEGRFAATSHGNPFERRMVYDDDFGYRMDEDPEAFDGWRNYVLAGEVNDGNAYYAHGGIAGHAGLFSTADELLALLELLLQKGVFKGRRYFSESVADTFLTEAAFGNGLGWAMSAGILRIEDPPAGTFGHTGFTGTYAAALPSEGLAIVLLTNRQNLGVGPDGRYNSLDSLRAEVASAVVASAREGE